MMEDTTPAATSPPTLQGLLERLLDEAEAQSPPQPRPSSPPPPPTDQPPAGAPLPTGASPQGASPLGALLTNPAVLSALPVLMENVTPLLGSLSGGGGSPTVTRPHPIDRHTALLCAIKPYLSPHRQEAAETVIRLCRIWDALERSGISITGLLSSLGGTAPVGAEGGESRVQ